MTGNRMCHCPNIEVANNLNNNNNSATKRCSIYLPYMTKNREKESIIIVAYGMSVVVRHPWNEERA